MTALQERLQEADVAGLPDWQAADALNAPDPALPTARRDIPTADAREVLLTSGVWPVVVMTADNAQVPDQVRGLCITVRDALLHTHTLRLGDPVIYGVVSAMLDGLIGAGLMGEGIKPILLGLAEQQQSWAEVHGLDVTARTVGLARGAIA